MDRCSVGALIPLDHGLRVLCMLQLDEDMNDQDWSLVAHANVKRRHTHTHRHTHGSFPKLGDPNINPKII